MCVPYTVDFIISHDDGIVSVLQTGTSIGLAEN